MLLKEVGLQADPQLQGCTCRQKAGPGGLAQGSMAAPTLQPPPLQGTVGGQELAQESLSSKAEGSKGCAGFLLPGGPNPGLAAAPPSWFVCLFVSELIRVNCTFLLLCFCLLFHINEDT